MPFGRRNSVASRRDYTRVFFATDVHGSDDCWKKFLNASRSYDADVLVMGGDITGKAIVPVVRQPDSSYECEFLGSRRRLRDEDEVAKLEKVIRRSGGYPYRTDSEAVASMRTAGDGAAHIDELALELMLERVRQWVGWADERLAGTGVRLLMGCGNDDPYEIDAILGQSEVVEAHDSRVVRVDEHHELIGLGWANPTPWNCPRDVSEAELAERIAELAAGAEDLASAVFCIHVPPIDSHLDTCPRLDPGVYPPKMLLDASGQPMLHGAGSTAVREAIERHQPLAGLHGHIHESRGVATIGRTQVFNPGSEYSEGILRGVILNLAPEHLLSYQFTSG